MKNCGKKTYHHSKTFLGWFSPKRDPKRYSFGGSRDAFWTLLASVFLGPYSWNPSLLKSDWRLILQNLLENARLFVSLYSDSFAVVALLGGQTGAAVSYLFCWLLLSYDYNLSTAAQTVARLVQDLLGCRSTTRKWLHCLLACSMYCFKFFVSASAARTMSFSDIVLCYSTY